MISKLFAILAVMALSTTVYSAPLPQAAEVTTDALVGTDAITGTGTGAAILDSTATGVADASATDLTGSAVASATDPTMTDAVAGAVTDATGAVTSADEGTADSELSTSVDDTSTSSTVTDDTTGSPGGTLEPTGASELETAPVSNLQHWKLPQLANQQVRGNLEEIEEDREGRDDSAMALLLGSREERVRGLVRA